MRQKRALEGSEGNDGRRDRKGKLPVQFARSKIIRAFARSDVLILVGDTGSGKSTQVPQMILDDDWGLKGKLVAVTQPRRVAAMSVASRVATERGCRLGDEVSYAVRFDDCTSHRTRLKYATDGILMREALEDQVLSNYAVVVIDEVHERSISTDVLLGISKQALAARRGSMKLIVMSATPDIDGLKKFYDKGFNVEVVSVPGRTFPIEMMFAGDPVSDYLDGAITATLQVHTDEPLPGDILVFLTGQEEIDAAISILESRITKLRATGHKMATLVARPLYAALPSDEQMAAIEPLPPGQRYHSRKVMFATNVAETSITIRNVKYVIDTGVAKSRTVNLKTGADILRVGPVSKSQARQRAGRAGRESQGKCFRLYVEDAYHKMEDHPIPEILRCDLASAILHLLAMGIGNPFKFDFIDPPPKKAVANALELLFSLSAVDEQMALTELGKTMSSLPLPPMLARSTLEAKKSNCLPQMLTLAAMLTVESPFLSPRGKRDEAAGSRKKFASVYGDHISLYYAYKSFEKLETQSRSHFCRKYFLNVRSMIAAQNIRKQIEDLLGGVQAVGVDDRELEGDLLDALRMSLVAGYFRNAAFLRSEDKKYVAYGSTRGLTGGVEVDIHPSSCLRGLRKRPALIIFHELILTTKSYVRTALEIEKHWLVELSNGFFRTE
eukprot:CAMPEP_0113965608 /NCGR_PEP_ID=MMETSP0011_2-20120614/7840_1 /TAXON_ID=101924 /ORGANISM="Rhodosorus marinus" /LENGTH=669 /DNA_ID=CAMNT_0000978141 /DNA_START=197 /DNA_END=2206 /DNA_ORIENTATION=- /assembly_acc=CAM_ASM_000156